MILIIRFSLNILYELTDGARKIESSATGLRTELQEGCWALGENEPKVGTKRARKFVVVFVVVIVEHDHHPAVVQNTG